MSVFTKDIRSKDHLRPEGPEDDVCFPLDQEESGIAFHLLDELLSQKPNNIPPSVAGSLKKTYDSDQVRLPFYLS